MIIRIHCKHCGESAEIDSTKNTCTVNPNDQIDAAFALADKWKERHEACKPKKP